MANTTSPVAHKRGKDVVKTEGLAINAEVASKYWLELISFPAGNNNRLWLFVNNTWAQLPDATPEVQELVQNAFNNGSNSEVEVWYDDTNQNIVGLIVSSP